MKISVRAAVDDTPKGRGEDATSQILLPVLEVSEFESLAVGVGGFKVGVSEE